VRKRHISAGPKKIFQNGKIVIIISGLSIAFIYGCDCTRSPFGPPAVFSPSSLKRGPFLEKPQNKPKNAVFELSGAGISPEKSLYKEEALYLTVTVALDYEFDGSGE